MNRTSRRFGWKPDLPDHRDFKYAAAEAVLNTLPQSVDLRPNFPPIYDQGDLGSCTANAIAGAFEFEMMKQKASAFMPSRLFVYYNERVIEGTVITDSGANLRDGLNSVSNQGVCTETAWPYTINEFAQKPYQTCYQAALQNLITSFYAVSQDINQMKGCLSDGFPFVFGFTVYQSFETTDVAQSGKVPFPGKNESVLGGHAVVAVGYDDAMNSFIVRNSWGGQWGDQGYCYMPYEYLLNNQLAAGFWTIRLVSNQPNSKV